MTTELNEGIPGVNELPAGWKTVPIKFLFSFGKGLSITKADLQDDGINVISYGQIHAKWNTGVHLHSELIRHVNSEFADENPYALVPVNGFIFADTSEDLAGSGNCAYVDEDIPVYAGYHTITLKSKTGTNNKYLAYLFQTDAWRYQIRKDLTRVKVYSISQQKLRTTYALVPPANIQASIVSFLDEHCAASKHHQIIEKLEEYRKAVITQAVTKGLNQNVEMKDCSDKWFGNIPAEWTVKRLKYLFQTGDGQLKIGPFGSALKGKTIENGPYKIYNQANVIQNDFSISRHYVSDETYDELKAYTVLPDDVLFTMMGTIGKCQIMPHNTQPGIMDSHLLKARLNGFVLPEYFVYAYDKDNTDIIYNQLIFMTTGSIMNGLNSSIIKEIRMPVPPVEEQRRIVSYLDKMCGKIDTAIEKHNQLISKLQEYKQSLIYNAVTGKIDCTTEA